MAKNKRYKLETARPELKYYCIKYACIAGGRKHKKRITDGTRQTKTFRQDCSANIHVLLSSDKQYLEVKSMNMVHEHEISEVLFRQLPKERRLPADYQDQVQHLLDLQFNALTNAVDVQSLSQFADGSLFCDIVTCVYSQAEMGSIEMPKIDSEEGSSQVNKSEIEQKYEIIEKFIDTFFQIKSCTLVAYHECIQGEELELAKVCVILLSAMVQNFLSTDNEALKTIMLLDVMVQEDIKEFLALLLERSDNKGPLTKTELHKVLGKASRQKATPRRQKSDRGTPAKKTPAKHGERVSTMVYEDMMESPLKGLLQSPVSQHKMVVQRFKWDTELSNLRKKYYEEESKVFDLMKEKRKMEEDFTLKKEELHQLKIEFRKFKEISEEKEGLASMERANFLSEISRLIRSCFRSK